MQLLLEVQLGILWSSSFDGSLHAWRSRPSAILMVGLPMARQRWDRKSRLD
jgi:hypothetical protein